MGTLELHQYIEQKLAALNKEMDMNEVVNKGQLSFGLNGKDYKHLPSWNELLKNKKKLITTFWTNCFVSSFIIVGLTYNMRGGFEGNWIKGIASCIGLSLFATLMYAASFYFNLFYRVRKTEHEVRKLIYEDLLDKLNK